MNTKKCNIRAAEAAKLRMAPCTETETNCEKEAGQDE